MALMEAGLCNSPEGGKVILAKRSFLSPRDVRISLCTFLAVQDILEGQNWPSLSRAVLRAIILLVHSEPEGMGGCEGKQGFSDAKAPTAARCSKPIKLLEELKR